MAQQFPSASHAWQRISKCIAVYHGQFNGLLYDQLANKQQCVAAIAQLQQAGNTFTRKQCWQMAHYVAGTFNITHPQYVPPSNTHLPAVKLLINQVLKTLNIWNYMQYRNTGRRAMHVANLQHQQWLYCPHAAYLGCYY